MPVERATDEIRIDRMIRQRIGRAVDSQESAAVFDPLFECLEAGLSERQIASGVEDDETRLLELCGCQLRHIVNCLDIEEPGPLRQLVERALDAAWLIFRALDDIVNKSLRFSDEN